MDTRFSPDELAFREEVRAFLAKAWTADLAARFDDPATFKQATQEWQRRLYARGWGASGWPAAYGGAGWNVTQRFIFESERGAVGAADVSPFGLKLVGPIIYTFGSEEQKQRFLPGILSGEEWWCQGYSEPGAGSDLAGLTTKAELLGDEYRVNGTKIWTTYAHHADWIFCLVRTECAARKQDGISFLLIDMSTPGISVRPIGSIDGVHSLNEVRFEEVRVPANNRVGEQGKGWTYAKALLTNERGAIVSVADSKRQISLLCELARRETGGGRPLLDDPAFRNRVAEVEIRLAALEYTELRVLSDSAKGKAAGAVSSLLKIHMDLAGYYCGIIRGALPVEDIGHDFGDAARRAYFYGRASSIYGGSNEIQKNIFARAVLGL
jgi:alkylation response protein AidB-like acyl-CoA dehydrogenase